jgi:hypothetical protein
MVSYLSALKEAFLVRLRGQVGVRFEFKFRDLHVFKVGGL